MSYFRHVIDVHSKNKEVEEKLNNLDQYFYEVLELVPATAILTENGEDAMKMAKTYKLGNKIINQFMDMEVYGLQRIEELDTKMDGINDKLDRLEDKLDIIMSHMDNIPESTKRLHCK